MKKRTLPKDFVGDVKRILADHVGIDQAITLPGIYTRLCQMTLAYQDITSKDIRAAIQSLRDGGALICSLGSDSDGYYQGSSIEEYRKFRLYYASYAMTILHRLKKMDQEAEKRWGWGALQAPLL